MTPLALFAMLLAAAPGPDDVAPRPTARLLSFDQLQARLKDPALRVLDARPRAEYDRGHLPGAVWVDAKAAQGLATREGGLADKEGWSRWVAPLAIGPDQEVVIYDAKRQLDAARLWWLLGYLGVEKVGLIDGGFPLWTEQGRPVTRDLPEVEPRPFPVRLRPDRHADRGEVRASIDSSEAFLIDARSPEEYAGDKLMSKRGGHIPTACHLEWSTLVDEQGRFRDPSAVRDRLRALGVPAGQPVITHCQGGGRASVDAFVLERLGHPARNYYLGWSDWGNRDETPVVTGKEKGERP